MANKRGICALLCVCFLFLGIFLGAWLQWKSVPNPLPGGNQINFQIDDFGDLNLVPAVGDTISWSTPAAYTGKPGIDILPVGGTTCTFSKSGRTTSCTLDNTAAGGTFVYNCQTPDGKIKCADPVYGPVPPTKPIYLGGLANLFGVVDRAWMRFEKLFARKLDLKFQPGKQSQAGTSLAGATHVRASVGCSATQTTVDYNVTGQLSLNAGDIILWTATNDKTLVINPSDFTNNVCKVMQGAATNTFVCTVTPTQSGAISYSYTASLGTCSGSTPQKVTVNEP